MYFPAMAKDYVWSKMKVAKANLEQVIRRGKSGTLHHILEQARA